MELKIYEEDEQTLVRVAWYIYKLKMTQQEVANKLNISRSKVVRMLKKAEDLGIIHIHVISKYNNCLSIEKEIMSKYKLKDAFIVPDNTDNRNEGIALAAAQYLEMKLKDGDRLGIGWGDTINRMTKYIALSQKSVSIVTLTGGLMFFDNSDYHRMVSKLSRIANGQLFTIQAPLIVSSEELCDNIKKEELIKKTLDMAKTSTYTVIGVGALDLNATIFRSGYLTKVDYELLKSLGAVGDILGQFYDENGDKMDIGLHRRLISFDINNLPSMSNVIAVCAGQEKIKAIKTALKKRYFDILITDESTATSLLS